MNEIEKLVAIENIRLQLYLYCQGVDRRDWSAVRSVFADELEHSHGSFKGSADEFIEFASKFMKNIKTTQHSITNLLFDFSADGLSASTFAYFNAVHFIEQHAVATVKIGGTNIDAEDKDTDWLVEGTYDDRWVLRDGQWLIVQRLAKHNWERMEPAMPR